MGGREGGRRKSKGGTSGGGRRPQGGLGVQDATQRQRRRGAAVRGSARHAACQLPGRACRPCRASTAVLAHALPAPCPCGPPAPPQDLSAQRLTGGARIRHVFTEQFARAMREAAPVRDVSDEAILTVIKNGTGVAGRAGAG